MRLKTIPCEAVMGRMKLLGRWARFSVRSARAGYWDFVRNAIRSSLELIRLWLLDVVAPRRRVRCNICGWVGNRFYPNTGPGYDERDRVCPGCRCQDRHRSLVEVLKGKTTFFEKGTRIVECAPMRNFQRFCLAQEGLDYTSFDLERYAMEQGDITRMSYPDGSVDYFLALHVLEHIPDEAGAIREIMRVLKPGGVAVLQVPLDESVAETYEYDKPDPREVGHVRRYGRDFGDRLRASGFDVEVVGVGAVLDDRAVTELGLSRDDFYLAARPGGAGDPV